MTATIHQNWLVVLHGCGDDFYACFYDINPVMEQDPDDEPLANIYCRYTTERRGVDRIYEHSDMLRSFDIMDSKIATVSLQRWKSLPQRKYKWRKFKLHTFTPHLSDEDEPTWDNDENFTWNAATRKWEEAVETSEDESATSEEESATGEDEHGTGEDEPLTGEVEPATGEDEPLTGEDASGTGEDVSATGEDESATRHETAQESMYKS